MGWAEWIIIVLPVGGLIGAACLITKSLRVANRSPGNSADRFVSGYLGAFGLMLGLASGMGLVAAAEPYIGTSWVALVVVIALNIVAQPLALLICWIGLRKIVGGLSGRIGYAYRIPECELIIMPPPQRRALTRHCLFAGLVALSFGVVLSLGFVAPLLEWAVS